MLADFFNKPLHGSKFKLYRGMIMEWGDVAMLWNDSDDKEIFSSTSKEWVEDT